jgi:hypothetical protein
MHELKPANREVVQALVERLVTTYEQFGTELGERTRQGLTYIDGIVGVVNFVRTIVLDLEDRVEDREGVLGKIVLDTLEDALRRRKRRDRR